MWLSFVSFMTKDDPFSAHLPSVGYVQATQNDVWRWRFERDIKREYKILFSPTVTSNFENCFFPRSLSLQNLQKQVFRNTYLTYWFMPRLRKAWQRRTKTYVRTNLLSYSDCNILFLKIGGYFNSYNFYILFYKYV